MTFASMLFAGEPAPAVLPATVNPECLVDLNLDQVVAGVTAGRERHHLRDDLSRPLRDEAVITDRQQVCRDIGRGTLRADLDRFAERLDRVRRALDRAGTLTHRHQVVRWQLDAAAEYHRAVVDLQSELSAADLTSRGLTAIRRLLTRLLGSAEFRDLGRDLERLGPAVRAIRYRLHIVDNQVRVQRGGPGPDYADAVEATFRRFRQGRVRNHSAGAAVPPAMNYVESGILDLVAELYPDVFAELDRFGRRHARVVDDEVATSDRDIQFFLGYLDYIAPMIAAGLPFCYPTFDRPTANWGRDVEVVDTFDLALAARLVRCGAPPPVRNDITLAGRDRILLVTGPNNGGKTTYARTVGQLHQLAPLGLPVPGRSARLVLCDNVFTHFTRPETTGSAPGKLQDELVRMREILRRAGGDSVVVLNEPFTSTALADAIGLGGRIIRSLTEKDLIAVYVTFVDELAGRADGFVSMVATVPEDDPTARTFRVVRRPANGTAHALAVRHRLTYRQLTGRIAP